MSQAHPEPDKPAYQLFVGIDIALESFTVCLARSIKDLDKPFELAQTPQGFSQLRQHLEQTRLPPAQVLVVIEATNTYWMQLALDLAQAGYAISVINPRQALHFAKAQLKRAKTDQIDAQTLATLAASLQPDPWSPPPAVYEALLQLLSQRDAFLAAYQQERNRLALLEKRPRVIEAVRQRSLAVFSFYEQQLKQLDSELAELLKDAAEGQPAVERLSSIKGLGPITTGWLLVATVGFSACQSAEQAAAYAGLAPNPYESGKSVKGKERLSASCHRRLRRALYMAALTAIRYNPQIKAFYQRLRAKGKPKKLAICACARKLLGQAWAVVKHDRAYDPAYGLGQP